MSSPIHSDYENVKTEGNNLFKQGKYKEAIEKYSSCIKTDPTKPAGYTNRSLCRLKLDQNEKAQQDCNDALKIDSKNIKAFYRRAMAKKAMRKYPESIDDLKKLLEIEPGNVPAQKELQIIRDIYKQKLKTEGDDFFKKRNYHAALQRYTSWIGVNAEDALPYTNRALCYLELKEFKKAEEDCTYVIEKIDENNEDAYYRRVLARKAQNNFSGSDEDWNTLIEGTRLVREITAVKLGEDHEDPIEPSRMKELLDQFLLQQKYSKVFSDGDDFYQKNNYAEAKSCFTSCLEMIPNDSEALTRRAQCYLQLNQDADAERDCNIALESDPENVEAFLRRAEARKGLERFTESKSDLEEVIASNKKEFFDEARVELDEVKELIIFFSEHADPVGSKCSLCNVTDETPRESQSVTFCSDDFVVTYGNMELSYEEATVFFIDQFFPRWHSCTYKVPAGHFHETPSEDHLMPRDLRPEKNKKGKGNRKGDTSKKMRKASDIKTERDGSNAVETIVQLLEEWGNSEEKQPMFILKDYEFRFYLQNITKLGIEKGDHDILVIHRRFGILAIQVKCSEKEKELSKAYKQACKDERIFRKMNMDLDFARNLKVTKAIAMTEMNNKSKFLKLLCADHKSLVLTKSSINMKGLKSLLRRIGFINTQDNDALSAEQYRLLVGRYVGLVSAVPYRTLSDATAEAENRIKCLQLNPEQLHILQSKRDLLLIQGASGTGKTFLLVQRAKMMARQMKSQVYIILLSAINEITSHLNIEPAYHSGSMCAHVHLRNHIKQLIGNYSSNLHVVCEHEIRQRDVDSFPQQRSLEKYVSYFLDLFTEDGGRSNGALFDFFFDEVPRIFLDADMVSPLHLFKCSELFARKPSHGANRPKRGSLRTLWIAKTADQPCLRKPLEKSYTPFAVETLKNCVRLTKANFEFVKAIVNNYVSIEDDKYRVSGCRLLIDYFPGNVILGVKPLYASLEECKIHKECNEEQIPDNPELRSYNCLVSRLEGQLKKIFQRLTPITCPIQILVNDNFFGLLKGPKKSNIKNAVGDACTNLGCNVTGDYVATYIANQETSFEEVEVNLGNYEPFVGCESEILIVMVDNYSLIMSDPINLLGMLSRVMGQLVIVRLPQNGPKSSKMEKPFERACNTHALKV